MRKIPLPRMKFVWQEGTPGHIDHRYRMRYSGFPAVLAEIEEVLEHREDGMCKVRFTGVSHTNEKECVIFFDHTERMWKHGCYAGVRE